MIAKPILLFRTSLRDFFLEAFRAMPGRPAALRHSPRTPDAYALRILWPAAAPAAAADGRIPLVPAALHPRIGAVPPTSFKAGKAVSPGQQKAVQVLGNQSIPAKVGKHAAFFRGQVMDGQTRGSHHRFGAEVKAHWYAWRRLLVIFCYRHTTQGNEQPREQKGETAMAERLLRPAQVAEALGYRHQQLCG